MHECTFATTVFERTYREKLQKGYIASLINSHQFVFTERIVTINNVDDLHSCIRMAQNLVNIGEIDRYVIVKDELHDALYKANLPFRKIAKIPYYTDRILVALSVAKTPYLLYQDIEIPMRTEFDWITDGMRLLANNPHALVVNPNYEQYPIEKEAFTYYGPYAVDFGFSDHIFLVRTSVLIEPFHQTIHWASYRYPLAPIAPIFEQFMDSYERTHDLFRFTDRRAIVQADLLEGQSYQHLTLIESIRHHLFRKILIPIGITTSIRHGKEVIYTLLARFRQFDELQQDALRIVQREQTNQSTIHDTQKNAIHKLKKRSH